MAKIKGLEIELGGNILTVPPLNFNQLQELDGDIEKLNGSLSIKEQMRISMRLVHAAVSRNYPEITILEVGEWLDLQNVFEVVGAVLGNSGFAKPDASDSAGEGGSAKK